MIDTESPTFVHDVEFNTDDLMPTIEADILVVYKGMDGKVRTEIHNTNNADLDILDFDRKLQWEQYCEHVAVPFLWCYLQNITQHLKEY